MFKDESGYGGTRMFVDVLAEGSEIVINKRASNILGHSVAFYFSILIDTYKRAVRKHRVDNDYFKVDRGYIRECGMAEEEQLNCEGVLMRLALLKKSPEDPDKLRIDVRQYASLIGTEDVELVDDIRSQITPKARKETKREMIKKNLKDGIECSNYELLTALRGWVDAIFENPKGFLSKTAVKSFQDTLNDYTKGDLDLALKIVNIASVQGYRDCHWAITLYERDQKNVKKNERRLRITEDRIATKADLSDKKF